jgi:hypothetical protein
MSRVYAKFVFCMFYTPKVCFISQTSSNNIRFSLLLSLHLLSSFFTSEFRVSFKCLIKIPIEHSSSFSSRRILSSLMKMCLHNIQFELCKCEADFSVSLGETKSDLLEASRHVKVQGGFWWKLLLWIWLLFRNSNLQLFVIGRSLRCLIADSIGNNNRVMRRERQKQNHVRSTEKINFYLTVN